MISCRIAVIVTAMLLLLQRSIATAAGSTIGVHVFDATNKATLSLARVVIVGASSDAGYTNSDGVVRFDDLVPGTYQVSISRAGYQNSRTASFALLNSQSTSIEVTLDPI